MKSILALILVSGFSACVPANEVSGSVSITGGQGPCADEDGDPLQIEVTAYDASGDDHDEVDMKCGGGYTLALDAGTYRIRATASSPEPIFGTYWIESEAEVTVSVVDGQPTTVPALVLSVD
jgi:hypothetical protein